EGRTGDDRRRDHRGAGRKRGLQKPTPMKSHHVLRHSWFPDPVDRRGAAGRVLTCSPRSASILLAALHGQRWDMPRTAAIGVLRRRAAFRLRRFRRYAEVAEGKTAGRTAA